jgi:hypothetical protein
MQEPSTATTANEIATEGSQTKETGMNPEQAHALAEYVNQNDRQYRASVLQLPGYCFDRATPSSNKATNAFVLLSNRNTGGNPPLLGGLHDYAEALRQQRKEEALRRFEQWQQEGSQA